MAANFVDIAAFGYDEFFAASFRKEAESGELPARVVGHNRHYYEICCEKGRVSAKMSGAIRYVSVLKSELPAVGDWVAVSIRQDKGYIRRVLPRKNYFSRRSAGGVVDEQVIAANIDTAFLVMALDGNYNLKRLQRYLSIAAAARIKPVILLTKSDICENVDEKIRQTEAISEKVPVYAVSSLSNESFELVNSLVRPRETAVFVGSSGVGKSTLINLLLGEERLATGKVSAATNKGQHTTSARELILLKSGGIVIDTPGMKELQMWQDEELTGFEQIEELAKMCRFADCLHETEPDCAVKQAIEEGTLSAELFEMWKKQQSETRELRLQKEKSLKILETRRAKRKRGK
ncbi:ribosome small subunit-dependent GTPase A [bacterium]|nr:ribosome small subunit-dependent GTPase A [bacterium]MBP5434432.1 ribosome small subunit-dependent GTPase A [bacterium]MBR6245226.1 ribosome small subunit-dependent GTPase A [bacterium]